MRDKELMKIVLIPGLGFDCRIFDKLNLSAYDVEYLNWIEPKHDEGIHEYSQRLFSSIETRSEKIVLVGHSMGGVAAQEIASANIIDRIVLISSIKTRKELPLSLKITGPLKLHKLFTKELTINTFNYWGKSHGFTTNETKNLFLSMVGGQTNHYLQWALSALSSWKEPALSPQTKITHIHGTKDKTLPFKLIRNPDFTIENGSHFCVYNQANAIQEFLEKVIQGK